MLEISPLVPPTDTCFRRDEDSGQQSVLLEATTAEQLRCEAVLALRSLPRRGLEIGGILLGDTRGHLHIGGVQPVESEHLYGPRYQQSERDRKLFETSIRESKKGADGTVAPVGIYRTYTQESGGVAETDSDAMRTYFPGTDAVFLLVFPKLTGRANISCFRWDGTKLTPCDSVQPAPTPLQAKKERAPSPVPRRKRFDKRKILNEALLAGLAALVVFLAISWAHHTPASARIQAHSATPPTRLNARVEATADGARVVWDTTSETVRNAAGGLLTVTDEGTKTELPISAAELMTGNLLYGAAASGSEFVLRVYTADDGEVREVAATPNVKQTPP